ncbi:hypothetical protein [Bartonella rattimassiliensis]|nr:hypothetical protein [Bartonella rattimassiliensis]
MEIQSQYFSIGDIANGKIRQIVGVMADISEYQRSDVADVFS